MEVDILATPDLTLRSSAQISERFHIYARLYSSPSISALRKQFFYHNRENVCLIIVVAIVHWEPLIVDGFAVIFI